MTVKERKRPWYCQHGVNSLAREPAPALLTAVLFTGHDGRATAHKESLYHPMAATLRQSGISMLPSRNLRPDQAAIQDFEPD